MARTLSHVARQLERVRRELTMAVGDVLEIADRRADPRGMDAAVHVQGAVHDLTLAINALLARPPSLRL